MKGFPKTLVHLGFRLSAPIIRLGKRLSGKPVIGRIINPVFTPRHNQLTAVPIQTIAVNEDVQAGNGSASPERNHRALACRPRQHDIRRQWRGAKTI